MKKIKEVPKFKSIEEEDVKFAKNLTSVYKKVANAKGIGNSTAARMLIRERLAELNIL